LLAYALITSLLLAAPHAARALEPTPRVEVQVAPDMLKLRADRIVSAVAGQLIDVADVDAGDAAAPAQPTCVVRIEEGEQGLVLEFADANGVALSEPRIVSRMPDELAASEAATIVRAFVIARIASAATPPAVASEAPPAVASEAAPLVVAQRDRGVDHGPTASNTGSGHSRSDWRAGFTLLYTGATYAPELSWQNGVRLEGWAQLTSWLHGGFGYVYHPVVEIPNQLATVQVASHDFDAFAGVGHWTTTFGAGAELGLGLTDTERSTSKVRSSLMGAADSSLLSGVAFLRLRGRVRFPEWPRLALDVAPALEVVTGTHALVIQDRGEVALLSPNRVRARVDVGVSLAVF
jgi:hypothetical protein